MEHLTEYLIIFTNLMLFLVTGFLCVTTALDQHTIRKIALLLAMRTTRKRSRKTPRE
jgi:hypothetical protein